MEPKTIWFIFKEASPVNRGAYSRHFFIARELVKRGYKVYIFASAFHHFQFKSVKYNGKYTLENIDGVIVYWLKGIEYSNPHSFKRVLSWFIYSWRLMRFPTKTIQKPSSIIISSPPLIPILAGIYFKRKFKDIKLILEIRDIWPQTFIDIGNYSRYNPMIIFMRWVEKLGYHTADHILSTLPKADEHIKNTIKKPFHFRCIPQGIDSEYIESLEDLDKEFIDQHLPGNKFIVGYAGTIGVSNALETLIQAARLLSDLQPNIQFVLVGDGYYKNRLVEQSKDLSNISFLPRIEKTKVIAFLETCDVLYDSVKMVPLYKYGLSRNKWIEYMYSGKPIIASYTGHLSLINEAECGAVVPAEDVDALVNKIISFYNMDPKERAEIGLRGKEFVKLTRKYDRLTDELIDIL